MPRCSCCAVPGCSADLTSEVSYCQHRRVCPAHLAADAVDCAGVLMRYCLQCGRFQALQEFDGTRRSCRATLNKRRQRSQRRTPANKRRQAAARRPAADSLLVAARPAASTSTQMQPSEPCPQAFAPPSYQAEEAGGTMIERLLIEALADEILSGSGTPSSCCCAPLPPSAPPAPACADTAARLHALRVQVRSLEAQLAAVAAAAAAACAPCAYNSCQAPRMVAVCEDANSCLCL